MLIFFWPTFRSTTSVRRFKCGAVNDFGLIFFSGQKCRLRRHLIYKHLDGTRTDVECSAGRMINVLLERYKWPWLPVVKRVTGASNFEEQN